jgi:hypothetical protein
LPQKIYATTSTLSSMKNQYPFILLLFNLSDFFLAIITPIIFLSLSMHPPSHRFYHYLHYISAT